MKKSLLLLPLVAVGALVATTANQAEVKAEGEEIVINPMADYRFQDADNLGKDTSGNGFDLTVLNTSVSEHAIEQLTEEATGAKYLSLCRDEYESGESKGTGACLYAKTLANGKDFSDIVTGSYTMEVTLGLTDNEGWSHGDRYAVTTGRYNSCYTIIPWRDNVTVGVINKDFVTDAMVQDGAATDTQNYVEKYCYDVATGNLKSSWVTVTTVCDASTGIARFYVNGVQMGTDIEVPGGIRLSNWATDEQAGGGYAFCIGAQTMGTGSATQFAKCCYKNVTLYDCALSSENVAAIYAGEKAVISKQDAENNVYVTALDAVKTDDLDLDVTDANPLSSIISDQLSSKKVKVTTSDTVSRSYSTFWYPVEGTNKIRGRAQVDGGINVNNLYSEIEYQYVAKFDVPEGYVDILDVTLDNKEYVPGTAITETRHTIRFQLQPKDGVTITGVTYNEMDWEEEEDEPGIYYIQFTKGAKIVISTEGAPKGSEPDNPGDDPSEKKKIFDCSDSMLVASALISVVSACGIALVSLKKKED